MERTHLPLVLSVLTMALAAACLGMAVLFQNEYLHAHGVVHQALREAQKTAVFQPIGLPNPEKYFTRAQLALYAGSLVWALATIVAFATRRWYGWLAFLVVSAFIFVIPLCVLYRV